MARKFLAGIDLTFQQLLNAVLQNLATAPSSPVAGLHYFDTALGTGRIHNGTAWVATDASKLVGTIPMTALTVDPTNRANHTGTQLAATISDLGSTVHGYSLSSFAAPTGNLAMGGYTLTGLSTTPNAVGQAAEYSWVISQIQSAAAGISSKAPVTAVATTNIATLSGLPTVDGITMTAGQRLLLPAQTTTTQNGVYAVAAGAWTRVTTEASNEMDPGATWLVLQGTTNGGTLWRMATTGTITVGTTAISIVQFSTGTSFSIGSNSALNYTAGVLTLTLQSNSGLVQTSSGLAVDTSVVAKKQLATITGDGATTSFNITHSLAAGTSVMVQMIETSTGSTVDTDITRTSATNVNVSFPTAPAVSKVYNVIVIG
jgi:hypothetical protein